MPKNDDRIVDYLNYEKMDCKRKEKLVEDIESCYLDVIYGMETNKLIEEVVYAYNKCFFALRNAGSVLSITEKRAYEKKLQLVYEKLKYINQKNQKRLNDAQTPRKRF